MYLNYRVVQYTSEAGEIFYKVQQVQYDDKGIPVKIYALQEAQAQNTEILKNLLVHQLSALTLPILDSKIVTESTKAALDLLKGNRDGDKPENK